MPDGRAVAAAAGPGRDARRPASGPAGSRARSSAQAADVLCQDLTRKLTGKRPSDAYFRAVTKLGEAIEAGGFEAIAGIEPEEILMPYSDSWQADVRCSGRADRP